MELARVFLECDLRMSFPGLTALAKASKWDLTTKSENTLTLFMNRSKTKFKMFVGPNYIVYYSNGNRRIPLEAIQHFPTFFNGSTINVSKAIEKHIRLKHLRLATG